MSRRRTPRHFEALPVPIAPWLCPSNKRGYATREDAQTWLVWLRANRADGERVESRAYRCVGELSATCGSWHLTSDANRQVAS